MVNPLPVPPSAAADARNRAYRTFVQGLGVDVAVAVLPALYDAVSAWDGAGGETYWSVVGFSIGKTAVVTAIAYAMRKLKAPAV